jgi:hypothetical protein
MVINRTDDDPFSQVRAGLADPGRRPAADAELGIGARLCSIATLSLLLLRSRELLDIGMCRLSPLR